MALVALTGAACVAAPARFDEQVGVVDSALWGGWETAFTTAADAAHPWWRGGHWTGWESLGGAMRSDPAVSSWGPGRLDVFYIGTDQQLKHRFRWDGGSTWAPGEDTIGGLALDVTPPGAVSWGPGRIDVFARALGPGGTAHTWWQ